MATKILNTRLKLRYDTFTNWSTSDVILLSGEAAVAYYPSTSAVDIKIGDGVHTYNQLPSNLFARASDVAAWAKTDNLEWSSFTTHVLSGLSAYIEEHSTSTEYTQSAIDGTGTIGLQFQHKEPTDSSWTNDQSITLSEGLTNGTIHVALSGSTAKDIPVHGLGTAAYKNIEEVFRAGYTIVPSLPPAAASTMDKIYLVPSDTPGESDSYVSYITLTGVSPAYFWEKVGDSTIQLEGLDSVASATSASDGQFNVITSVTETDGKISLGAERKLAMIAAAYDRDTTITDEVFILDCGDSSSLDE